MTDWEAYKTFGTGTVCALFVKEKHAPKVTRVTKELGFDPLELVQKELLLDPLGLHINKITSKSANKNPATGTGFFKLKNKLIITSLHKPYNPLHELQKDTQLKVLLQHKPLTQVPSRIPKPYEPNSNPEDPSIPNLFLLSQAAQKLPCEASSY